MVIVISLTAILQRRYAFCFQYDESVNFRWGLLDRYDRKPSKDSYYAFVFYAVVNDKRFGQQFVKKVVCVEGERLYNIKRDFYCNGKYIGTAKEKDKKGNQAPLYEFNGIIEEGKFFVVGDVKDSYDSKYWGFVDSSWVVGKVTKIF